MFTRYRTFFIMFGILVFFLMIFAHGYKKEGFADYYLTNENKYEKGGSVNINGEFNQNTEVYKRYNTFGPFSTKLSSTATCDTECNRQDECNAIRGNKCTSSFDPNSKTCFCSFSKIVKPVSSNGMGLTVENLLKKATYFDNQPKPSWVYPITRNEYNSHNMPYAAIPWSDLNIPNKDNMAFSFWINLNNIVKNEKGFFVLWISYAFSLPMYVRKDNKTLVLRNIHDNNKDFNITIAKPTWIVVSLMPGVQNVYIDGKFTYTSTSQRLSDPPNEKSKLYLGQGTTGVFIKDLMFYDHSLTEDGIGILYKGLKVV
jgi:hypothetical protein